MHGFSLHDIAILLVEALGLALLVTRLISTGLYRIYPAFTTYVVVVLLQLSLPFIFSLHDTAYAYAYIASEAVILCFYALIVLELYSIVFRDLTGIGRLARVYTKVALGIAIAVSVVPLWSGPIPNQPVTLFQVVEYPVMFSLVIFILLITAFLSYYPVPLSRNAIVYSLGYAIYFLSKATLVFMRLQRGEWRELVSTVGLIVSTACVYFWALTLTRRGEQKQMVIGHSWNAGDRNRVLLQLQSINEALLRTRDHRTIHL